MCDADGGADGSVFFPFFSFFFSFGCVMRWCGWMVLLLLCDAVVRVGGAGADREEMFGEGSGSGRGVGLGLGLLRALARSVTPCVVAAAGTPAAVFRRFRGLLLRLGDGAYS